jgi:hypothetical protein
MLGGRPEPGGDEDRAELVAVQGGGMRLIVQPGAANVRRRRVIEELFLDGLLVEASDGAQPTGHSGPGTATCLQFPGERLDVGTADGEQRKRTDAAPRGELPQVQGVRLAGQASVARHEPREREPLGIGERWLDANEAVDGIVAVIGYLRDRLRPGRLGQPQAPAINEEPNVSRAPSLRHVTLRKAWQARDSIGSSIPPNTR